MHEIVHSKLPVRCKYTHQKYYSIYGYVHRIASLKFLMAYYCAKYWPTFSFCLVGTNRWKSLTTVASLLINKWPVNWAGVNQKGSISAVFSWNSAWILKKTTHWLAHSNLRYAYLRGYPPDVESCWCRILVFTWTQCLGTCHCTPVRRRRFLGEQNDWWQTDEDGTARADDGWESQLQPPV